MEFSHILDTLPPIDRLSGLNILAGSDVIAHIPAVAGKLGALRVYNALAQEFNGKLDRTCAQKGLVLFAEHTADARQHPGKHPNIDLLLKVLAQDLCYRLLPVNK
ncbi:DUF2322 family protein [Necropsobacter massiliensis]|uniref:DUF2322 family protein n=1 Tax=Necropsobacter massiliensis TaxID=1400001 RepID=UPI000595A24D|nr:DUF2322 family protein [Necropsobacter massiliensis]